MKKILLAGTALAFAATAASAADLPRRSAPAPVPYVAIPVFTWTGFYVGVNAGYAGDKFEYPFSVTPVGGPAVVTGAASLNSSGFLAGGTVGYNWQFGGNWVLGLEADYQWANVEGKLGIGANFGGGALNASLGSEMTQFGTVRARVGYAFDRALVYVTGGWAYGRTKSGITANLGGFGGGAFGVSLSDSNSGWTLGGGLEYALTNNISFKTEYLYVDLGDTNLINTNLGGAVLRLDAETKAHIVRAGINYRFWSPAGGAVVARY
ncbi:MAG TPA: outer membrane protein [Beijerinckiaceae bacterium]